MTITPATITDLDGLAKLFDAYRVWYRKETDLARAKIFLAERINKKESIIYLAKE
ncbi:MAG TPA: GNAT family N-acetyltransferase, partial [Saprospiraceae bacterium]|nr:GNAT family N-acetyltransferase [Saprospiraceae bacterium]